ncbi:MAG TPA: hypothetical protein VMM81_05310 [Acidimicrobiia bacterium]|nr:hypothetical protein [Acidimicrobiia bacterium]
MTALTPPEDSMAYNRNQARPLLTKPEFELFEASLSDRISSFTPAQLRTKADRARRLADKYRDLYRRQGRAARVKTGSGAGANERTDRKTAIFEQALGRFEARLARLGKAPAPQSARGKAADRSRAVRSDRRKTAQNLKEKKKTK